MPLSFPSEAEKRNASLARLTPAARKLYEAIITYKRENDGCAPTLRELMVICQIRSSSNVSYQLDRLAIEQLIIYVPGARNLRVAGGCWSME